MFFFQGGGFLFVFGGVVVFLGVLEDLSFFYVF